MLSVRGWNAAEHLRNAGKRPIFSGANGWMLDRHHLADVLAYFQDRRIAVVITDLDQPELPDGGDVA